MSEGTIRDFENGHRALRPSKATAIRQAFELAGVIFTSHGGPVLTKAAELRASR